AMREMMRLPKVIRPFLVARLKVLANLAVDEHRKPQDGRVNFNSASGIIDIRLSVMPLLYGEKAEMRLLALKEKPWTLSDLGLNSRDEKVILNNIKKSFGMIIAAGPTGCGKTTILYTILDILNTPKVNIMTIEDPIEYSIPGINQVQVNPKAGITFASGLRSIVRQDPDIIMVGEIRDSETAEIAIHAAMTGHLVLTTIHTTDAAGALPRLIDLGIEPFLVSSTLNLVIAERLTQRICLNCIESYSPSSEIKKLIKGQLAIEGVKAEIPETLYRGKGCKVCEYKGYKGRVGIFECLDISKKINKLILEKADSSAVKAQAIEEGMTTMLQDGLEKVETGVNTIEEVLRVIRR
ncbi:MAG: GspE/PulE family protein, partial [Ignavibacteria bacterium]|nr:GspE/PulE family protein [Ignavibacteria bacterium]